MRRVNLLAKNKSNQGGVKNEKNHDAYCCGFRTVWHELSSTYIQCSGYPFGYVQCRSNPTLDNTYGFYKSHCTSYVAYMLNMYGVSFNNAYRQPSGDTWSHGGLWDTAAGDVVGQNIIVDNNPLPGDVAYWNSMYENDPYGHVAWVEKVYFNSNGIATDIDITEYNYNACSFGQRKISVDNPSGFIHILAYNEAVGNMYYLDCYEMSTLCPNQTQEEWKRIVQQVWNNYRCANCTGNYNIAYVNALAGAIGGMGGGYGAAVDYTDSSSYGLPDFIMDKLTINDSSGNERYLFNQTDTIQMHSYSKNIGDADWEGDADDIYVKFYLSKGYKEDSHSEWKCVGTEQISEGNLDTGDTKHEWTSLNLATANNGTPLNPGAYNIVACVDRKYDQDNGDGEVREKHESNNCSTEAVFTISTPNYAPVGNIELVNCSSAQGWARDPNVENPINVHVYRGDVYGNNKVFLASFTANIYRSDVGSHVFSWTLSNSLKTGVPLTLFFYGIDTAGGSNPLIGQTAITCAAPPPSAPSRLQVLTVIK